MWLLFKLQVVVAPPLYPHQPQWYRRNLPQVALRFSATMTAAKPPNLLLLPSFCSQDLTPDGLFLTPISGLHYILHLFDSAASLLELEVAPQELQQSEIKETVRRHDDRLAYLESSHGQLISRASLKAAIDSEFDDWVVNRSEEDWLTIQGLKRLPSDLDMGQWQSAAKKQVIEFLRHVLKVNKVNMPFIVHYVQNPIRHRAGQTVYNVQLDSVGESKRIRELYSGFFRHNRPVQCPSAFKGISVRNKVTLATRVRIAILQQLGANYKSSNPGSSIRVKGYLPRPLITIFPARGSSSSKSDSRPKTFNFIGSTPELGLGLHEIMSQSTRGFSISGVKSRKK